jgi:hypothetical protein
MDVRDLLLRPPLISGGGLPAVWTPDAQQALAAQKTIAVERFA